MAGLKKADQLLLAVACLSVLPLVNGKLYSYSVMKRSVLNQILRLHATFPCARLSVQAIAGTIISAAQGGVVGPRVDAIAPRDTLILGLPAPAELSVRLFVLSFLFAWQSTL